MNGSSATMWHYKVTAGGRVERSATRAIELRVISRCIAEGAVPDDRRSCNGCDSENSDKELKRYLKFRNKSKDLNIHISKS